MKIVYRIGAALLALCIVPNMLYKALIRLVYTMSKNGVEVKLSILKMKSGKGEADFSIVEDLLSKDGMLHDLISNMSGKGVNEALKPIIPYGIASGVLLALAVLVCLAIFVINVIKPMQKTTLILCGCGLLLNIAAMIAFNRGFAGPLVDGTISVSDIIGGGIFGLLASMFTGIDIIQLSTAATLNNVIFTAIAVWTAAFLLTDLGAADKDKKKIKNK
ncbi:MAG: hypothetical protein K5756_07290 [Clostridiales bacterium]|nr:hypothetical protein [Clostridiales bacterium]